MGEEVPVQVGHFFHVLPVAQPGSGGDGLAGIGFVGPLEGFLDQLGAEGGLVFRFLLEVVATVAVVVGIIGLVDDVPDENAGIVLVGTDDALGVGLEFRPLGFVL